MTKERNERNKSKKGSGTPAGADPLSSAPSGAALPR
jgi:hypothetical protein